MTATAWENVLAILPARRVRYRVGLLVDSSIREESVFLQLLSVVGALMILAAYGLIQNGVWRALDPGYLTLNILGSLLLGIVALAERQIGFILLEFAWAGVGCVGAVQAWKARRNRSVMP